MSKPANNTARNYTRYYDSPDGCDIFKKVMVTTRYGIMTGFIFSAYDVLMYSHANGFRAMARRYAYHTVPLVLMGATFAVVANGVQNYRKKDDAWNYFAGGLACGPIVGMYVGSWHGVVVGGLALGLVGMVKKDSIQRRYDLFPEVHPHMGTVWRWRHDYTLVRDPRDDEIDECK